MQVAALKDGDAQDGDAVWTAKVVAAHAVWPPAEGPEPALRSRMAQDAQGHPEHPGPRMPRIFLGILGEYIARIHNEVKRRPIYIIDKLVGGDDDV